MQPHLFYKVGFNYMHRKDMVVLKKRPLDFVVSTSGQARSIALDDFNRRLQRMKTRLEDDVGCMEDWECRHDRMARAFCISNGVYAATCETESV